MLEFWKQPRTIFPSIFRVLIGILLLFDLIFTLPSGNMLFDFGLSYSDTGGVIAALRDNYTFYYVIYGVVLVLFICGIGKNIISLVVFILYFLSLLISPYLLNWGDTILKFTLLFFVFVDAFRHCSIQRSNYDPLSIKAFISQLAVWSIILNLFLIYLSNGIYKSMDPDWQLGYAPFYSFSQFSGFETSIFYNLLSEGIFGKIISYMIIAQQLTFIPLVIWKKTRYHAMLLGILIHMIMFFQFGLWKFELIMILLYGFLLNDNEWKKIIPQKQRNKFI